MNSPFSYTLLSRSGTKKGWRWNLLTAEALSAAILLADLAVIIAMSVATGVGYHTVFRSETGEILSFIRVGALTGSIFIVSNIFRGEYKLPHFLALKPHFRRSIQLWNVTFVCLLAVGFMTQITVDFSRGWMLLFYTSGLSIILLLRCLAVQIVARASRAGLISTKRIFLVGRGRQIEHFLNRYEPWNLGVQIVGCRFLTSPPKGVPQQAAHETLERDLEAAVRSARQAEPDAVFIFLPWADTGAIDKCVEKLLSLPAELHLSPQQVFHKFNNVQLAKLGPMLSLQLTRLPLSRMDLFKKRIFDLFFSAVALIGLAPLMLALAVLIKLDSPGPVFFLQRRFGFNQRPFRIVKFRTMRTLDDGAVVRQVTRDDARVTRVGRWLRRWSIDEIPQLLNVLKGDMSLVGPRPHALSHNHEYEQKISVYARRHNVKPGITGWAQIHGLRGETDTDAKMHKRVEYDLYYIEKWSLALDFRILIQTAVSPAVYRNAY